MATKIIHHKVFENGVWKETRLECNSNSKIVSQPKAVAKEPTQEENKKIISRYENGNVETVIYYKPEDRRCYIVKNHYKDGRFKYIKYFYDGKLHNENGPAVIVYDGSHKQREEFCINGVKYKQIGYNLGAKKSEVYYDKDGNHHREDGPALILWDYSGRIWKEYFYKHGKYHREDGPAMFSYENGKKEYEKYFKDGNTHREDGPAVIIYNPNSGKVIDKQFWLNNEKLSYFQFLCSKARMANSNFGMLVATILFSTLGIITNTVALSLISIVSGSVYCFGLSRKTMKENNNFGFGFFYSLFWPMILPIRAKNEAEKMKKLPKSFDLNNFLDVSAKLAENDFLKAMDHLETLEKEIEKCQT